MRALYKNIQQHMLIFSVMLSVTILFMMPGTLTAQDNPVGILEDIPEGGNRIIMIQEGVPPADVYVDVYDMLVRQDFKITASSETLVLKNLEEILDREPLIIEARKQVEQDMAIQLTFNVNPTAGVGGKLLASVKYAANVDASAGKWKEAKWTDGLAQEAFIHALDLVRHARYDAMEFEVGVAVTK